MAQTVTDPIAPSPEVTPVDEIRGPGLVERVQAPCSGRAGPAWPGRHRVRLVRRVRASRRQPSRCLRHVRLRPRPPRPGDLAAVTGQGIHHRQRHARPRAPLHRRLLRPGAALLARRRAAAADRLAERRPRGGRRAHLPARPRPAAQRMVGAGPGRGVAAQPVGAVAGVGDVAPRDDGHPLLPRRLPHGLATAMDRRTGCCSLPRWRGRRTSPSPSACSASSWRSAATGASGS